MFNRHPTEADTVIGAKVVRDVRPNSPVAADALAWPAHNEDNLERDRAA